MSEPSPGVYFDIPFDEYRAWPGINYSSIAKGAKSMRLMHHAMTTQTPPTAAMALGKLTHLAVLEPDRFEDVLCIKAGRKTGAFKGAQAETDEDIYTVAEYEQAAALRDVVMDQPEARRLVAHSKHEVCLVWDRPEKYGRGKIRIDMMGDDYFADLKTARDIALPAMVREFTGRYGRQYELQWGWFWEALEQLNGGYPGFDGWVIAVETGTVPDAYAAKVNGDLIKHGQERAVEIARQYHAADVVGIYTGADGGDIPEIYLPDYLKEDWSPDDNNNTAGAQHENG